MEGTANSRAREQALLEGVIRNLGTRWALSPRQVAALSTRSWMLAAERGAYVARRGARLYGVIVVAYGSLKLMLRRNVGEERIVRLLSAGQTFGEGTSLLGKPCPYDALALTDCKLVIVPSAAVLVLMEQDARFARRMALALAERNHELLNELESATLQRGPERFASFLASLAGHEPGNSYTVVLPVSKTLVAARLGMKKETFSRLLRRLSAERLIEVARREVRVLDASRIADLARTD